MTKKTFTILSVFTAVLLVVLIVFAAKKNIEISRLNDTISEKDSSIQNLESAVSGLNDTIKHMENSFRIITPAKYIPPAKTSAFQKLSGDDAEIVGKIFASAFPNGISDSKTKNSEAIQKEFNLYLSTKTAPRKLVPVPGSTKQFIDADATILQALCEKASLSCKTSFLWDSKRYRRWTVVQLPTDAPDSFIKISIGGSAKANVPLKTGDIIELKETETTVFPISFDLFNSNEFKPFGQSVEVPLGGLYVHYIKVFSKGDWRIEYKLPGKTDPDFVNVKALSLNPACSVNSAIEGNKYVFTISAPANEAEFILFGDNAFIPDSVTASLLKTK